MERALETQRLRLLRLLAGLVFALALVPLAPAVSMVPRWIRSYVSSVLARMESAADGLVIVSAYLLFRHRAAAALAARPIDPPHVEVIPEDGFSVDHLLSRISALRAKLNNLPRHARRLIQRCSEKEVSPSRIPFLIAPEDFATDQAVRSARIDRPPDKGIRFEKALELPLHRGGRSLAWAMV